MTEMGLYDWVPEVAEVCEGGAQQAHFQGAATAAVVALYKHAVAASMPSEPLDTAGVGGIEGTHHTLVSLPTTEVLWAHGTLGAETLEGQLAMVEADGDAVCDAAVAAGVVDAHAKLAAQEKPVRRVAAAVAAAVGRDTHVHCGPLMQPVHGIAAALYCAAHAHLA